MMYRCLIIIGALLCGNALLGQSKVMTYNIRYDNPQDGDNQWTNRKAAIVDMLLYYRPDIFGIQEGLHHQVSYLDAQLADYNYVGVGRDDGLMRGEYTAIFYNTQRYTPIETQTYWLSSTPDRVSVGWDASMERITTFAVLVNHSIQDTLYVFNAHFDHIGSEARERSAQLINSLIAKHQLMDKRVVVMGDLNCLPDDMPIHTFMEVLNDSYEISKVDPYGPSGTWCSFDIMEEPKRRIDYILTKNLSVIKQRHIDDKRPDNLNLSDHLPVLAIVR